MAAKKFKVALFLNLYEGRGYGFYIPLSLLYLGAYLHKENHETLVLDRRTYKSDESYIDKLRSYEPDLVGITLYANGYTNNYRLINEIRRFERVPTILLGGPEVSANRAEVVNVFDNVDYFLVGEAEHTISKLANCLAESSDPAEADIAGLSYRTPDGVVHNPTPNPIVDIDTLEYPRRDLIDEKDWKQWYYRPGMGRPTDSILTSRGCPFRCRFCYRLTPGYRVRSTENVLGEIKEIHDRGAKGLFIMDDNFTIERQRCIAILEGIASQGWKLAIKCRGRVNSMDPDLLKLMKKVGVHSISFGIESGSQKILNAMAKGTTVEQNHHAIRMVVEAGIQCYADMILGYPGESAETIQETTDFLAQAKPTGILLGGLYPLHGTEVFNEASENGSLVGDWGLLKSPPWVKLPWMNDYSDLQREVRKIHRKFYLNPGVLFRGLKANICFFSPRDYIDVMRVLLSSLK